MRIDASPYELIARADGRRREGALLRATFDDGVVGFADVHPWTEFGDEPLDRQFEAFARGERTPLSHRSLALARADGEARAIGRSLFAGLTVPPSHASLPFGFSPEALEGARAAGYARVKLKGWAFSREALDLFRKSGLLFRLDFNARRSFDEVVRILESWDDLGWIDWLEDPCPYGERDWNALRSRFGVRLALDFETAGKGRAFDVRVVKPARDEPDLHTLPIAFTSYLDHPVGQLGAAWTAARALAEGNPLDVCGLATHPVYEENAFSRRLGMEAARLVPPDGPGLGFARELEALAWRTLEP